MKVWLIVLRADADAAREGVEDEAFTGQVFSRLERAKKECVRALQDDHGDLHSYEIEWAETTEKGKPRKFLGRPVADVEECFELYQAEVV